MQLVVMTSIKCKHKCASTSSRESEPAITCVDVCCGGTGGGALPASVVCLACVMALESSVSQLFCLRGTSGGGTLL